MIVLPSEPDIQEGHQYYNPMTDWSVSSLITPTSHPCKLGWLFAWLKLFILL